MKCKRAMSILLAAIIAISLVPGLSIGASAATNGHSQSEAVNWANAQVGKSLDYDGVYGCQCVDLIKYYYAWMGVASYAHGNACEYQSNALPAGWTRVYSGFRPGDIGVWKPSYNYNGYSTGSAGHVGIIVAASGSTLTVVNQNFAGASYCTKNNFPTAVIACAIRPDFSSNSTALTSSWSGPTASQITQTNAYLSGTINFSSAVKYTAAGVRLYDANGNLIAKKDEKPGNTASYLKIWYDVNSELGVTLKAGTKYSFKFYVVVGGREYWSGNVSFTTAAVVGKTTNVKAASADYNKVKITWSKVSGADGYVVYRATSKDGTYKAVKAIKDGSTVSYTNEGKTGTTYYYKVRAFKLVDGVRKYGSYSSIVSAKPVPKTPYLHAERCSSTSARLQWTQSTGANGYVIYRATSKTGEFKKVATITSAKTVLWINTGLKSGHTYYFKLRPYTTVGGERVYGSYTTIESAKL